MANEVRHFSINADDLARARLALVASLLAGSVAADDASDYSRLRGVWSFTAVEVEGARQPAPPFETNRLVISEGGRYTIVQGSRITRGSLKLDPSRTPKHYDVTITEGRNKGLVTPGIYEVGGDSYRICLALRGKDRPSSFATQPGSGLIAFSFKREQADPKPALIAVARQEMAGTWQAVSYALSGEPASAEDMKKVKLVIDGSGQAVASSDGKVFIAGTTTIDPTGSPMTLDVTYTEGDINIKGQTALGIYKIEDDVLTICRAAPGRSRPAEFSSPPGSGLTLMTYQRDPR
jgi:uncharacterized protein (TIGR03067 family)